jgi:hypothetical protein
MISSSNVCAAAAAPRGRALASSSRAARPQGGRRIDRLARWRGLAMAPPSSLRPADAPPPELVPGLTGAGRRPHGAAAGAGRAAGISTEWVGATGQPSPPVLSLRRFRSRSRSPGRETEPSAPVARCPFDCGDWPDDAPPPAATIPNTAGLRTPPDRFHGITPLPSRASPVPKGNGQKRSKTGVSAPSRAGLSRPGVKCPAEGAVRGA